MGRLDGLKGQLVSSTGFSQTWCLEKEGERYEITASSDLASERAWHGLCSNGEHHADKDITLPTELVAVIENGWMFL